MLSIFRRLMKNEKGATAIEYTLIASLIAVAADHRDEDRRWQDPGHADQRQQQSQLIDARSVEAWAARRRTAHFFSGRQPIRRTTCRYIPYQSYTPHGCAGRPSR